MGIYYKLKFNIYYLDIFILFKPKKAIEIINIEKMNDIAIVL